MDEPKETHYSSFQADHSGEQKDYVQGWPKRFRLCNMVWDDVQQILTFRFQLLNHNVIQLHNGFLLQCCITAYTDFG